MLSSLRAFNLSVQIRRAWPLPSPASRVSGNSNIDVALVTHPRGAGEGGAHLAGHKGPTLLLFFLTICTTPSQAAAASSSTCQYSKEERLPPQTFIPLQSLRLKPITERLRTLGGSAQLIFDVTISFLLCISVMFAA